MKTVIPTRLLILILTAGLLTGCLPASFFKELGSIFKSGEYDDSDTDQVTNIKIVPLRIPKSGEHLNIRDPETGEEYSVTIGEVYTSASGKHCGRYTVEKQGQSKESGLVCFENQEEWIKVPLQLPENKTSF